MTWPSWSVRVKPGAGRAGTGDSSIRLTWLSGTAAGIPDGRAGIRSWPVRPYAAAVAPAAMSTAASAAMISSRFLT